MILRILSGFMENTTEHRTIKLLPIPQIQKPNRRLSMLGQYLVEVNHNPRCDT
jgi:hypothetical protein